MFKKNYMNHVSSCILFLIVGDHAMAQVDTVNKSTVADTGIISQIKMPLANTSVMPHGYYLAFHTGAIPIHKISIPFFPYNYSQDKFVPGTILNVASTVFLSYLGDKTHHTYYYRSDN